MTHDRDYYRAQPTDALLDAATYEINPNWQELAIALAERLKRKCYELEGVKSDLSDACYCYD